MIQTVGVRIRGEHGPFIIPGGILVAGRKPKTTVLKKLEGNPGKRKLNTKEPVPGKGMPVCPKWLLPEAKEYQLLYRIKKDDTCLQKRLVWWKNPYRL